MAVVVSRLIFSIFDDVLKTAVVSVKARTLLPLAALRLSAVTG